MRARYQIVGDYGNDFHAGPKAQRDVTAILEGEGFRPFVTLRTKFKGVIGRFLNRLGWLVKCRWLRSRLPKNVVLFMQYPSEAWSRAPSFRVVTAERKKKKKLKLIVLVHDLTDFRDGLRRLAQEEHDLMDLADVVILHNEKMVEAVAECGIPREKLVALECFDYLSDERQAQESARQKTGASPIVNVAGNLNVERSGWLRDIGSIPGVKWNLFGPYYNPDQLGPGDLTYQGCLSPEELPCHLSEGFGCVWYGESATACSGKIVDYLRFINPHKLSLYLAAGLPVIVWDESAVADFVLRKNVGLAVHSLVELPDRIRNLSGDDYSVMARNACKIGEQILRGEFTRRAVAEALRRIGL